MDAIIVQFLVGLYLAGTSIDGSLNKPSIHVLRLIIGLILIIISIFNISILAIR